MTYATVLAGLQTVLGTVAGINAVLDYEPLAIQTTPLIYSLLDSAVALNEEIFVETPDYQYRVMHRLLIAWQDNEQAETELVSFVNAIPEAVFAGQATICPHGYSYVRDMDAGWVDVAGQTYRSLDFYSETLEFAA